MNAPGPMCAPPPDPQLQARVQAASDALPVVLGAAQQLTHDGSDEQIHALALYSSINELFSACTLLASLGQPTAIPIVLRSMYEALVELDNLLSDPAYVDYLTAANLRQMIKLMKSGPLAQEFQHGRKADFDRFEAELAALKAKGIKPLDIKTRCNRVGRLDEYESLYALFCLDAHNNSAALADRHLSERADGVVQISFFGDYDSQAVARRIDFALQFLLQSAHMIHKAFAVSAPQIDELVARFDRERTRAP